MAGASSSSRPSFPARPALALNLRSQQPQCFASVRCSAHHSSRRVWKRCRGHLLSSGAQSRRLAAISTFFVVFHGAAAPALAREPRQAPGQGTKVYVSDSGIVHALLRLVSERHILSHSKLRASSEASRSRRPSNAVRPDAAYFWATHTGAELDLLLMKGSRRYGVEVKFQDAPRVPLHAHRPGGPAAAPLDGPLPGRRSAIRWIRTSPSCPWPTLRPTPEPSRRPREGADHDGSPSGASRTPSSRGCSSTAPTRRPPREWRARRCRPMATRRRATAGGGPRTTTARSACSRATWWTSSSRPSPGSGRSWPSTTARR